MPWQKVQAGGTAVDPATSTINFANSTASKSGDVTTLTFAGDISAVTAGSGLSGGGSSGAVSLAVSGVNGAHVGTHVADALTPGIPIQYEFVIPAGTTGNVDFVLATKIRITDVHLVKTAANGGGAGTIQLANGATTNYITDAMSIDVNDTTIVRAAAINDANQTIAAAGTLRFIRTRTASTSEACVAYVRGVVAV